jgi:hypothetical protein
VGQTENAVIREGNENTSLERRLPSVRSARLFPALLYTAREGDVETAQLMLEKADIFGDVDNTTA